MACIKQHEPVPGVKSIPSSCHSNIHPPSTPTLPPNPGKGAKKPTKRRKRLDPWYPKRKINKNPRPRPPPPSHYTCRICISYLPSESFIRWVPPTRYWTKPLDVPQSCIPHLARDPKRRNDPVCKTCVGAFMAAQLDTHGARVVGQGCMEPGCNTPWPSEKVTKYFPAHRLEEYNLAVFERWRADANLVTCLDPECGFVALGEPDAPGYPCVECPSPTCKARSCASCRTSWHTGQTCAEIHATAVTARVSEEERKTLRLLQRQGARRCPNCQFVVEKNGGCTTMVCGACRKYFYWDKAASAMGERRQADVGCGFGFVPPEVACEVDELQNKAQQVPVSQDVLDLYRREMEQSDCSALPLDQDDDL